MGDAGKLISAGVDAANRSATSLGGLVPCAVTSREGSTLVMALAVEIHGEGVAIPIVVVTDAPGIISLRDEDAVAVSDDVGTTYDVVTIARASGLGSMTATIWLRGAIPEAATRLDIRVAAIGRVAVTGSPVAVERAISGGPWDLSIPLRPTRTLADPPIQSGAGGAPAREPDRVPPRSCPAFRGITPIGQAKIRDGLVVCAWAIEHYDDRALLTIAALADAAADLEPVDVADDEVSVWDDVGGRYDVRSIAHVGGRGWSETTLEVLPPIDRRAMRLGIALRDFVIVDGARQPALEAHFALHATVT